jgi:hypothetical protein
MRYTGPTSLFRRIAMAKYKVPDLETYYPGAGCGCYAHNRDECGCDVDWTSREEYELMDEVNELLEKADDREQAEIDIEAIEAIEGQQSINGWHYRQDILSTRDRVDDPQSTH